MVIWHNGLTFSWDGGPTVFATDRAGRDVGCLTFTGGTPPKQLEVSDAIARSGLHLGISSTSPRRKVH